MISEEEILREWGGYVPSECDKIPSERLPHEKSLIIMGLSTKKDE